MKHARAEEDKSGFQTIKPLLVSTLQTLAFFCWVLQAESQSLEDPCLTTTNALKYKESLINGTDQERVYKFCPNTVINVGQLDFNNDVVDGLDMIPLRSNMTIQCGELGWKEDNCRIRGGSVLVDGTHHFGLSHNHGPLLNVVVKGLTFVDAQKSMVWITKPGTVTFQDCVFRESTSAEIAPVLADYAPASLSPGPRVHLSVHFLNCFFEDNRYGGTPSHPALVVGNGSRNRLVFSKTLFSRNDMVFGNNLSTTDSFLISTSGPLTMSQNCFEENLVGVSPVAVYGDEAVLVTRNSQSENTTGVICPFVSHFSVGSQVDAMTPTCLGFDAETCQAGWTAAPSGAPSSGPSIVPSMWPSKPPSSHPTLGPSDSPSRLPTHIPTSYPSFRATTTAPSSMPTSRPRRTFPPVGEPPRFPGSHSTRFVTSGASRAETLVFFSVLASLSLTYLKC